MAIDEISELLRQDESEEKLKWIIENCEKAKMFLIVVTSDIYNEFFKKDYNMLFDVRISFDYTSRPDSKMNNLDGCQNLELNEFIISSKKNINKKIYNIFEFNDEIINKILDENNVKELN